MKNNKSSSEPLAVQVERQLIEMIRERGMKPGDKLANEYELAEQLGVGRGTIREAVKGLISRNILISRQGSGTFISERQGIPTDPLGLSLMTEEESLALDLVEIRMILEPEIAAIAAMKATPEDQQKIKRQCDKTELMMLNGEDYGEEDILLHRYIAEASQNQVVGNLVSILHTSIPLTILLTNDELNDRTRYYHREIVQAILDRDPYAAKYGMIGHLSMLMKFFKKAIKQKTG